MRRLLTISSLRHLRKNFPSQNYCIYRHILNFNHSSIIEQYNIARLQYYFSTLISPNEGSKDNVTQLQEKFPEPKKILYQVLNEAFLKDQSLDLNPVINTEPIANDSNNEHMWKARLQMKWPESFEVEALAKRKTDALNISFLYACQKLKNLGVLDDSNKPALQKQKISDHEINSAKGHLLNIYQKIWHRSGNKDFMPRFNTVLSQGLSGYHWQTELHINYPEKKVFKGVAFRSSMAEGIAAVEALSWLKQERIIDKKQRLLQYTKDDEGKLKEFHLSPYSICLPITLQDKMETVLSEIERQKSLVLANKVTETTGPVKEDSVEDQVIIDLITDNPYCKLTDQEFQDRSQFLFEKNKSIERKFLFTLFDIKKAKSLLPISQKRDDILKLINENQVVILSGDTGCGKSTQVPQFILDHYCNNRMGAECNIIVTQPRRLATLALSERVAKERGEKLGDIVGHHIRFNKCLPRGNGAILYCTTGMLLRKMLANPNLEGISHVIIDEVHERNIQIDFILILLKNILESNKKVKLLLMSASFNTNLFVQYFNSSQVIHIPGKMHPIEEYFLEDLSKDISYIKNVEIKEPILNINLVTDVINHIDKTQPPGSILCFLPGWHDIRTVHTKLLEDTDKKFLICPIHSRLPVEEQKNIFIKPAEDQRKVILATNIAETSITIDDVVYVVNSGLHKGTYIDAEVGMASLLTQWITKANVRQRKGRAGRVKPGKCYHLFSWKTFMKMDEYPIAEILRMPLESVILDCKLYCQAMIKAEEFLAQGIQPPTATSIQNGINELQELGILDENENLTNLGKIAGHITAHPRVSVALVYARFLGCVDPVSTISSILTLEKEPFVNTLDDKLKVKKIKSMHDNSLCSDHLALTKIYDTWNSLSEETDVAEYVEKNLLDQQALINIKRLKEYFAEEIYQENIICRSGIPDFSNSNLHNTYNFHVPSVLASLTAAFYPHVIKVLQGEISQGRLNKNTLIYSIIKGQKAYIQKESVASEEEHLPTPWLIYFSALKSEARRKAMVSSVSTIPGVCLLLFAGKELSLTHIGKETKIQENLAALVIDDHKKLYFSCTMREAQLLLDWRKCLEEIFQLYLKNLKQNCEEHEYMLSCHRKLIPVLREVLETPQVPFTKGLTYEFLNYELISKQLPI